MKDVTLHVGKARAVLARRAICIHCGKRQQRADMPLCELCAAREWSKHPEPNVRIRAKDVDPLVRAAVQLRKQGVPARDIAQRMGLRRGTVYRYFTEARQAGLLEGRANGVS